MRKSGNAAIRLFFTLITDQISEIFVFESTSISIAPPPLEPPLILRSGQLGDCGQRLAIRVYISLRRLASGFLR